MDSADDVEAAPTIATDAELKSVARLAREQIRLQRAVFAAEIALETAQKALAVVKEDLLPNAMLHVGMRDFTTDEGYKINVEIGHHPNITKHMQRTAFQWLRDDGSDDIIKHDITVTCGRGEDALAKQIVDAIKALAPQNKIDDSETIHGSTLKKFVRERLADTEAKPLPFDVFGIYTTRIAEVTPPDGSG